MKLIIWGIGYTGKIAYDFLGHPRCVLFADKLHYGEIFDAKDVVKPEEAFELCKNNQEYILVIASVKHHVEMEYEIKGVIKRYFVFHETDTKRIHQHCRKYWWYGRRIGTSYTEVLTRTDLRKYSSIAVYGVSVCTKYLLLEILAQNPDAQITLWDGRNDQEEYTLGYGIGIVDSLDIDTECLILDVPNSEDNIRERLVLEEHGDFEIVDLFDERGVQLEFQHNELLKYKNAHNGERVFLIANGPSLSVDDLDTLHKHGEICIACNNIFRIYNRTQWRPQYLIMSDRRCIKPNIDVLGRLKKMSDIIIADTYHYSDNPYIKGINYCHMIIEEFYPNRPQFSLDITKGVYNGCSVIYDIGLQLAIYMGFQEIYILGADHTMSGKVTERKNHFIDDYYEEEEKILYRGQIPLWENITLAYEMAEKMADRLGVRIYNATRGGKLEVFQRVNFDTLFTLEKRNSVF